MPVLNEAFQIKACLSALQPLRAQACELIVADGGSQDRSAALAEPLTDQVVVSAKGRAMQMTAGARRASGDILWFLHADSLPPPDAARLIRNALESVSYTHLDVYKRQVQQCCKAGVVSRQNRELLPVALHLG